MQHDAMILCGLLRAGSTKACNRINSSSAHDTDDVLEHAALLLWKTLQRGDRDTAVRALLHIERKVWNRIAQLLFASSGSVVDAIVAVMCALVSFSQPSAALEPHTCAEAISAANGSASSMSGGKENSDDNGAARPSERPPQSIHERIWRSEWWQRIIEKIEDCYSVCLSSQQTSQHQQPLNKSMNSDADKQRGTKDVEICERLMQVVDAVLRHQGSLISVAEGRGVDRGSEDRARMNESVDLFVSLCTSPIPKIAIVTSSSLLSLLQRSGDPSDLAATKLFGDTVVIDHIAKWLKGSGASSPECHPSQRAASTRSARVKHENNESLQLQCVYFDLLVFAASSPSTEEVKWLVLDKVNPLQLCPQFLSHPSAKLQERALILMTVALQSSTPAHETKASAVCSNIRISGLLITICWLMGHSHQSVADAAGRLMDAVIDSSPLPNILRALVEQGCAIILSTLTLSTSRSDELHTQQNQDNINQSSKVLDWMATEIVHEQVLEAAMSSVLRSSNVLLQKNMLLSLLLLSQRDAELKESLDGEEENFLIEVVHVAIEASEDGSLAAMLLAAALSWCDKCSVLKLDDSGSSFRQQGKSGKTLREAQFGNQTVDEAASNSIPTVIKLTHKNHADAAEVDGVLLYSLSKLVQKWVDTTLSEPQIPLSQFRVATIQLFAEVLSKSQQEAVIILKHKDFSELSELLELAKYFECSKCWHFTTFAMNHTLNRSNWFQVFEFAIRIRHPSLMLRAGKMALECYEEEIKNGNSTSHDMILQVPDGNSGASARRFPELKAAAFQMYQEVFHAETSKRDSDQ